MSVSDRVKAQLKARADQLVQKYSLKNRVSKGNRKKIAKYRADIEEIEKKLARKWIGVVDGMGARASLYQEIRNLETKIDKLGGTGAHKMSLKESQEWAEADD